ncbi:MAG: hypothetical protein FWC58_03015 [Desulfobulbus sp.]|nr:hypothetical protein [Desulfobulbus sp.]
MPVTSEDFQDGALKRANQLLAALDPVTFSEEDLLLHGALLKIRDYLRGSSLRGDLAVLLAMITADFDDWISRPRNVAALVQALALRESAEILLGDAPTLTKICASKEAIEAIAANAQALNIFLDTAPSALVGAPAAFQSLLGSGFFVTRFVADPALYGACLTSPSLAPLIAADANLLAAIFANETCCAAFFDSPVMLAAAAQSSVVAGQLGSAARDALWANPPATDAFLKSTLMVQALIANGDLANRLKTHYATIFGVVAATRAGLWDDAFLNAFIGTTAIYQAFFQHANATLVLDSEALAVRLLRAGSSMVTSLGSYQANNANALPKNLAINDACGKNADLALALFKSNANVFYSEATGSIPRLYDHIIANPPVLVALLKDSTGRQRLSAQSLLTRKAALEAALSGNPSLFAKVINATTLTGVYGTGAAGYGRFHVLPDGAGQADVTNSATNGTTTHPCIVFIDQIGAATTPSTSFTMTTNSIGGATPSFVDTASGGYGFASSLSQGYRYTDGVFKGVAVGGFGFNTTATAVASAVAATATVWRAL